MSQNFVTTPQSSMATGARASALHTAVRYGLTQALLHATALAHKKTMAEIIAAEYGTTISKHPIPILASGHKDDPLQLDRTILKRVELLPHASFTIVKEHVGLEVKICCRLLAPLPSASKRSEMPTTSRVSISMFTARSVNYLT